MAGGDASRRAGRKGRKASPPFVMILHKWMNTPAWQALPGNAVKLLLHLIKMSKGDNGAGSERRELFLSERDAAKAIGVARNTASAAFAALVEMGFLRPVVKGHFNMKGCERSLRATVWRLTFQPHPQSSRGPTLDFIDWTPKEKPRAQKLNGPGSKTEPSPEILPSPGSKTEPSLREKAPARDRSISKPHIDIPRAPEAPPLRLVASST